jgi:hypothetical protein
LQPNLKNQLQNSYSETARDGQNGVHAVREEKLTATFGHLQFRWSFQFHRQFFLYGGSAAVFAQPTASFDQTTGD